MSQLIRGQRDWQEVRVVDYMPDWVFRSSGAIGKARTVQYGHVLHTSQGAPSASSTGVAGRKRHDKLP
jgi:hypothetical protein